MLRGYFGPGKLHDGDHCGDNVKAKSAQDESKAVSVGTHLGCKCPYCSCRGHTPSENVLGHVAIRNDRSTCTFRGTCVPSGVPSGSCPAFRNRTIPGRDGYGRVLLPKCDDTNFDRSSEQPPSRSAFGRQI